MKKNWHEVGCAAYKVFLWQSNNYAPGIIIKDHVSRTEIAKNAVLIGTKILKFLCIGATSPYLWSHANSSSSCQSMQIEHSQA